MGASKFSGQFNVSPDYFDGDGKQARESGSNAMPDLYALMKELAHQQAEFVKAAADGAAGTATAETPFAYFSSYAKSVRSVAFVPAAALTADNTNYATLIVRAYQADGTAIGIVAQAKTQITGTDDWTAKVPVVIPLSDGTNALAVDNAGLDIPAGGFLTFQITKTGTGVVVPAGVLSALVL